MIMIFFILDFVYVLDQCFNLIDLHILQNLSRKFNIFSTYILWLALNLMVMVVKKEATVGGSCMHFQH